MPITFACKCGKQLHAKNEDAGKRAKCPACGGAVLIPGAHATNSHQVDANQFHPYPAGMNSQVIKWKAAATLGTATAGICAVFLVLAMFIASVENFRASQRFNMPPQPPPQAAKGLDLLDFLKCGVAVLGLVGCATGFYARRRAQKAARDHTNHMMGELRQRGLRTCFCRQCRGTGAGWWTMRECPACRGYGYAAGQAQLTKTAPGAKAALICGVLSLVCVVCCGPAGIVLGIIALTQANHAKRLIAHQPDLYTGSKDAANGKVFGIIGTALNAVPVLLLILYLVIRGFLH